MIDPLLENKTVLITGADHGIGAATAEASAAQKEVDKSMKHKVLAYITRQRNRQPQLLVFTHRNFPEAGMQVPAGTVDSGEAIEAALLREIREESGLADVRLVRKLAEQAEPRWGQTRHVFQIAAPDDLPDRWTHTVRGLGEDTGLVFEYRWAKLSGRIELAGEQGQWLHRIGKDENEE